MVESWVTGVIVSPERAYRISWFGRCDGNEPVGANQMQAYTHGPGGSWASWEPVVVCRVHTKLERV